MAKRPIPSSDDNVTQKQFRNKDIEIPTGYLLDEFKRGKLLQLCNAIDGFAISQFSGEMAVAGEQPDITREWLADMLYMFSNQLHDQIDEMLFLRPDKDSLTMRVTME